MKKSRAIVIAALLPCMAYAIVVALTERVFWNTQAPPGKEGRAALAIRDNVSPFQKWGSRQFTQPYLESYYDSAWYFTQTHRGDCKDDFISTLDTALQRYPVVDIYLLAHSNQYIDWVAKLPPERRNHIRLVYNTGCRDLRQGPGWLSLGAKAYVGHPDVSASPVFYFFFLRRWTRGATLQEAIGESNNLMGVNLARAEVLSFGNLNAAEIRLASEAFCYGDGQLRFQSSQ